MLQRIKTFGMRKDARLIESALPAGEVAPRAAKRLRWRWLVRPTAAEALVLMAIVTGILLRFANLAGVPPAPNQDEAVNGYDAYSLFLTGRDHLGHPFPFAGLESFGDWASPLLTFLTAPAVGLFGRRAEVVRAVSAAIGVLAIPIVYLLAVELFRRRSIGILAAWLIAVSPWHVHRSRFAIPPAVVPTMVALLLLVLVWTVHRRSNRGIVAVALVAGLTIASYPTMKLYVPLLLLAALGIYAPAIFRLKREALCYAALVFIVIVGPIMYLSLADPGGRARLDQVSALRRPDAGPWFVARQYLSYFSPKVLFVSGNGTAGNNAGLSATPPGFGVELRSTLPLLLAGGLWLLGAVVRPVQTAQRRSALLLLAALALYPIPGSLTMPNPAGSGMNLSRAIHLIPLLALIAAVGAVALADVAKRALQNMSTTIRRGALALLLVVASILIGMELFARYADYFESYPRRTSTARFFQYELQQALGFARAHEAEYDQIWITGGNEPYIYVLFYNQWPPSDVHQQLVIRRAPPAFNQIETIGKYHFGDPSNIKPDALAILETIRDPDGKPVYEVRGGESNERGRVLVVRKL
jgi:4-amino-4-deoxy-L-arabinose transferase-like glycosyltransferase